MRRSGRLWSTSHSGHFAARARPARLNCAITRSRIQNSGCSNGVENIHHLIHRNGAFRVIPARKPLPHTDDSKGCDFRFDILSKRAGLLTPNNQRQQGLVICLPNCTKLPKLRLCRDRARLARGHRHFKVVWIEPLQMISYRKPQSLFKRQVASCHDTDETSQQRFALGGDDLCENVGLIFEVIINTLSPKIYLFGDVFERRVGISMSVKQLSRAPNNLGFPVHRNFKLMSEVQRADDAPFRELSYQERTSEE